MKKKAPYTNSYSNWFIFLVVLTIIMLSSCGPKSQYQVVFDSGEVIWVQNDNRIEATSGDTLIIENYVAILPNHDIYSKYSVWGYYRGILPVERVETNSAGDRRSRTWFKTAILYK